MDAAADNHYPTMTTDAIMLFTHFGADFANEILEPLRRLDLLKAPTTLAALSPSP